jgi:hypothetical protein
LFNVWWEADRFRGEVVEGIVGWSGKVIPGWQCGEVGVSIVVGSKVRVCKKSILMD